MIVFHIQIQIYRYMYKYNIYARRSVDDWNRKNNTRKGWKPTDRIEMELFFGLLLLADALKSLYRSTTDLWS